MAAAVQKITLASSRDIPFNKLALSQANRLGALVGQLVELVQAEAAATVLSDDAIVSQLAREGVQIARRTVAKYRKVMKIPSSAQRRRLCRVTT